MTQLSHLPAGVQSIFDIDHLSQRSRHLIAGVHGITNEDRDCLRW